MKDFTIIPNAILRESQLSIPARYLYCVMLRHCGKEEFCFPSHKHLAESLGLCDRQIRNLIIELEASGLVYKTRRGFNRSNNYKVSKTLESDRKPVASSNEGNPPIKRKQKSAQLGSKIPIQDGNVVPPNSIYLKAKDNNVFSEIGFEHLRKTMLGLNLKKDTKQVVKSLA